MGPAPEQGGRPNRAASWPPPVPRLARSLRWSSHAHSFDELAKLHGPAIHNRLVDVGLKLQRRKAVLNVSATSSAGAECAKRVCSKRADSWGQAYNAISRNTCDEIVGCLAYGRTSSFGCGG